MTIQTQKRNSVARNSFFCVAGFVLVVAVLLVSFSKCKIFPFGDHSLVYNDMQYQYTDYFMWLWRFLHGKESLLYSFQNFAGGGVSFFAYYLASPFNILAYFAKESSMAEFFTVLICLKFLSCYGTAFLYLSKRFEIPSFYVALLSCGYALMGYNLLQCSNVMWLDGVIILPVLALGIHRLVSLQKGILYYLALAYGVFSNWYVGYMLCLFSVLYLGFECVLEYGESKPSLRQIVATIVRFAVTSVCALLTICFLFFPQTLQMMREGSGFDFSIFSPSYLFSYPNGFRDLFLNGDKLSLSESGPMVFVGSLALFCVVLGLVSQKVSWHKKLLSLASIFGFMFLFCYRPLYYLFSVLKVPNSHHFRFAFLYSFLLIVVAAMCLEEIKVPDKHEVLKAAACIVGCGLLLNLLTPYSSQNLFALSCLFCILTAYAVGTACKSSQHRCLAVLLLFVCTFSEFSLKANMEFQDHMQSTSINEQYNQNIQSMIADLKAKDPGVYRVDKTFTRASGDFGGNAEAMAFGYLGISQYTSTANYSVAELIREIGYGGREHLIPYAPNLAADTVMGVKYVYTPLEPSGFEKIQDTPIEGASLYRNPQALAVAYKVASTESIAYTDNAFTNQQLLYQNLLGREVELYTAANIEPPTTDSATWTEWVVVAQRSGPLYVHFGNGQNGMKTFANGELRASNAFFNYNRIIDLGVHEQGDVVTLRVETNGGAYQSDYGVHVSTLNMDEFENAVSQLSASQCEVTRMERNQFSASYENKTQEKETVMLTVVYENGWDVQVNGKSVPYRKAQGCFIAFDVEPGANQIELRYHVPGRRTGIALSLLGILGFVGLGFWEKKKAAKAPSRAEKKAAT